MGVLVKQVNNFFTLVTVEGTNHAFLGDEPIDAGGSDHGPSPFNFLLTSLGT